MTDERIRILPDQVRRVFTQAASLTLEIEHSHDMPLRVAKVMMLSNGEWSFNIVGPRLFSGAAATAPFGVNAQMLEQAEALGGVCVVQPAAKQEGTPGRGALLLDYMLRARAEARGLPVHSLDSAEEQLGMYDSLARKDQIALLHYICGGSRQVRIGRRNDVGLLFEARNVGGLMTWNVRR